MPTYRSTLQITIAILVFFLVDAGIVAAQSDSADTDLAPQCITLNNILASEVASGHEVHFELRDGSRLIATLARDCPQLKFHNRFTYDATGGRLCAGEGRVVARGGETCLISSFTQAPDAPDAAAVDNGTVKE